MSLLTAFGVWKTPPTGGNGHQAGSDGAEAGRAPRTERPAAALLPLTAALEESVFMKRLQRFFSFVWGKNVKKTLVSEEDAVPWL